MLYITYVTGFSYPLCDNIDVRRKLGFTQHKKMEKYAKLLGKVWHFRHLKPLDLLTIVSSGHLKRYNKEEIIFQESDPSAGMFVLFSGLVHLCKHSLDGQAHLISVIEPVILFNEVTAIDGGTNPYTAIAVKDCLTWNIKFDAFETLVRRYPDPVIGLTMLRVLAMRTRSLLERCEDLSFRPVLARTAKLILELSDFGATPIDRFNYPIKDLAASIATVPESISRALSHLNESGLISCTRDQITILRVDELFDTAQVEPQLCNSCP